MSRWLLSILASALVVTALGACSDDDPAGPDGSDSDTTAPVVLSVSPGADEIGVAVGDNVIVVFNEAMDPDTAAGAVSLAGGTLQSAVFTDNRTLVIEHDMFAEGTRIDVTLATTLSDTSGNNLATAFTSGFWTESTSILLLGTDPPADAIDVNRNTTVGLLFSHQMRLNSLQATISVDDGTPLKAPVAFTLQEGNEGWWTLSFPNALPAQELIAVTIDAGAEADDGTILGAALSFAFTTGLTIDTTPPTLVGITPTSGSVIDPNTTAIVLQFSEPIDDNSVEPVRLGAQFSLLLEVLGIEPSWSADNTILTVPLPAPLPDGLPIMAEFGAFLDRNGNESESGFSYEVVVSGTPDPQPMVDGATFTLYGQDTAPIMAASARGVPGNSYIDYVRMEEQSGGEFNFTVYADPLFEAPIEFDQYTRSASAISLVGFGEYDLGVLSEVVFSSPVDFLRLPVAPGSWSGTTTGTEGSGSFTVDYTVTVLGQVDVPSLLGLEFLMASGQNGLERAPAGPELVWVDCWKTVLEFEISEGDVLAQAGVDTIYYAPAVGRIRTVSFEEDFVEPATSNSAEDVIAIDLNW